MTSWAGLNPAIFVISIIVQIIGVVADNLTTQRFIKDLGIAYESNPVVRTVYERWGFKVWSALELIPIIVLASLDFSFDVLFFGVFYGVTRFLVGVHNYQTIRVYRILGVDVYKEHSEWLNQQVKNAVHNERARFRTDYLVYSIFCFVAAALVASSTPDIGSSFPLTLATGLIFGIGSYYVVAMMHQSS